MSGGTATLELPPLEELLQLPPEDMQRHADATRDTLLTRGHALGELSRRAPEQRSSNWNDELRSSAAQITALDAMLLALESAARHGFEARAAEHAAQGRGPAAALGQVPGAEHRSLGQMVVEHENYVEKRSARFQPFEVRGLLTTSTQDTPAAGLWMPVGQPIAPRPRRMRMFLRNLIPAVPTNLNSVPYLMEVDPAALEGGASAVAEGEAKPEVDMRTELVDAPVRKVAGWVPVTDEILEDAPTLRGYIDTRLIYMVMVREQDMLLNGTGNTPQLRGIRQFSDVQLQSAVAGDVPATIGRAIAKVEIVDLDANGLVMHPTDFWTMVTTRHSTEFDAEAIGSAPIGAPDQQLWGLSVVRTRAMSVGKALVGDFNQATIWDRRSATISTTDSHSDYFIRNKLVILAEERIALSVHRPDAFVEATINHTAP